MMNMRSVHDESDLTAPARIRNAAIELIGEHGYERASMRMIAETAGVSPALIVHHFGDKTALREACNRYVAELFTINGGDSGPTIETIQAALANPAQYEPALRYLIRMLTSQDAAADDIFDSILQGTLRRVVEQEAAGIIRPQSDTKATALMLTVFGLAPLIMGRQFARALGTEALTPEALAGLSVPMLELFTHGLYSDDTILQATVQAATGAGKEQEETP